ncbi:MAG: PIN domain-containing protein, partial [Burkholderiales bacterium]
MVLVDTNVILDVVQDDPVWAEWSQGQLDAWAARDALGINAVIYAELSIAYARIEELEDTVDTAELRLLEIPREALFLA